MPALMGVALVEVLPELVRIQVPMLALVSEVTPAPLSTSCAASVLLSLLVPPNVSVCVVFGALKVRGALLVKLIAPDPQDSSALPADDPSVNWRLVLSPEPR